MKPSCSISAAVRVLPVLVLVSGLAGCASSRQTPAADHASTVIVSEADLSEVLDQARQAAASGDRDRAIAEFTRAIEINPTLVEAHVGMADIYRTEGDYANAQKGYETAAAIEPAKFDWQYLNGLMLHLLGRIQEAIGAYLRALAINPSDFNANLNVATAYYQLNENSQALDFALKAVQLDPADGSARFNLGAIYAKLDRHKEAVTEYQQAAELMELTPELLLNLAESLGRIGRFEEMRNTLAQLVKSSPTAAAFERLGSAEFRLRDFDAALSAFEKSAALDPSHYPAFNGVGVCLLNSWLRTKDSGAEDRELHRRGVEALRNSLLINADQPKVIDLLARYAR